MTKLTEKPNLMCRLFTLFSCVVFVLVLLCNSNYIKTEVRDFISPVLMSSFYDISGGNINSINTEFRNVIKSHGDIVQLELYKFTPENNSNLYGGQVNVAKAIRGPSGGTETRPYIPMVESTDNIRSILMNNVHHDTTETIRSRCLDNFDANKAYACSKYAKIDSLNKSIISIPLVDGTGYHVIGYITIALDQEYTDTEVQSLVNKVRSSVAKIQNLIR